MEKVSTLTTKQSKNFSEQRLTIGLDLGDRSSWYCVLDEGGAIVLEQKLGTTPKAMKEMLGAMPRCRVVILGLSENAAVTTPGWGIVDHKPPRPQTKFGQGRQSSGD